MLPPFIFGRFPFKKCVSSLCAFFLLSTFMVLKFVRWRCWLAWEGVRYVRVKNIFWAHTNWLLLCAAEEKRKEFPSRSIFYIIYIPHPQCLQFFKGEKLKSLHYARGVWVKNSPITRIIKIFHERLQQSLNFKYLTNISQFFLSYRFINGIK